MPSRQQRVSFGTAVGAALLVIFALAGCASHHDPTAPATATSITPIPLSTTWPHENGRYFGYRYVVRTGTTGQGNLFPTVAAVPAVTLDLVAALLDTPPPFTTAFEQTVGYTLTFQDSATTGSGVRGQNLVGAVTAYPLPAPFAARRTTPTAASGIDPAPPRFLGGGVWRQEPGRIGRFSDLSTEPTWIFLQGALADRTEWSAQLLPGFADDVLVRARAYQSVTADVAGLHFDDALDVHYLLDYGIDAVTDTNGGLLGYRRTFSYGRIIWGRETGPLYLYERLGLTAGSPPTGGVTEATLLLEQTAGP